MKQRQTQQWLLAMARAFRYARALTKRKHHVAHSAAVVGISQKISRKLKRLPRNSPVTGVMKKWKGRFAQMGSVVDLPRIDHDVEEFGKGAGKRIRASDPGRHHARAVMRSLVAEFQTEKRKAR